jgi:hypothetical protein
MKSVALPWVVLMAYQGYTRSAVKDSSGNVIGRKLPEPYYFLWGSAIMAVCAIIAQANENLGAVVAWASLLGAITASYRQSQKIATPAPGVAPA